jgi:hypothetical protein
MPYAPKWEQQEQRYIDWQYHFLNWAVHVGHSVLGASTSIVEEMSGEVLSDGNLALSLSLSSQGRFPLLPLTQAILCCSHVYIRHLHHANDCPQVRLPIATQWLLIWNPVLNLN